MQCRLTNTDSFDRLSGARGSRVTHEELIARAKQCAKDFRSTGDADVTLEMLPKTRVTDAVVVYFESDEHNGKIEVFMERASGKLLTAIMSPRKLKEGK